MYRELYDRLREHGYHDEEDKSSHLSPYVEWLKDKTAYQSVLDIGCSAGGSFPLLGSEGQALGYRIQVTGDVDPVALRRVVEALDERGEP